MGGEIGDGCNKYLRICCTGQAQAAARAGAMLGLGQAQDLSDTGIGTQLLRGCWQLAVPC
jgi:hypothetical protein